MNMDFEGISGKQVILLQTNNLVMNDDLYDPYNAETLNKNYFKVADTWFDDIDEEE